MYFMKSIMIKIFETHVYITKTINRANGIKRFLGGVDFRVW